VDRKLGCRCGEGFGAGASPGAGLHHAVRAVHQRRRLLRRTRGHPCRRRRCRPSCASRWREGIREAGRGIRRSRDAPARAGAADSDGDGCRWGANAIRCSPRYFLGSTVDLEETYRWGQEELARIEALRADVADQIMRDRRRPRRLPISTPTRGFRLDGVDALREWMQARGDEAIAELADTHFDIPGPVRVLEGHDRPDADGAGLYYTGPSDDFSRAGAGCGGRWPKGVTEFSTWRELTTVYHEGRSRPSPPGRADGLPQGDAEQVAPAVGVDVWSRRRLGAVCRAADG
jgi:hypothetical protein